MASTSKNKKSQSKSTGTKTASTKIMTTKNATVQINVVKNKSKKSAPKKMKVVSGFERYKMIEVAAYYLAEKHKFAGHAADYWIEAEKIINQSVIHGADPDTKKPKVVSTKTTVMQSTNTSNTQSSEQVDQLTIIEGIGPKIASLLNEGGILTFAELAKTPVATLVAMLIKAGPRYRMHVPNTWPEQAVLARDGKMDELKALQARLVGGKLK